MYSMMETILTAFLIGVDPFDQPAVETGKRLTLEFLARQWNLSSKIMEVNT